MVCGNFILPEICKPCLFLCLFQFAQLIVHYLIILKTPFILGKKIDAHFWTSALKRDTLFTSTPQIQYLICCVPTLYINNYWNIDIVFYLFISDFIALTCKDDMLKKVPKIKDFYEFFLCSNTIVSTWVEVVKRMPRGYFLPLAECLNPLKMIAK